MSQTWTQFMATVDEHLSVDANARGLEDFRERTMRNAVVDLQRHIRPTKWAHDQLCRGQPRHIEYAMLGNMPAGAIPSHLDLQPMRLMTRAWLHPDCRRNRLDFWSWRTATS